MNIQLGFVDNAGAVKQISVNRPVPELFDVTKSRLESKLFKVNTPKSSRKAKTDKDNAESSCQELSQNAEVPKFSIPEEYHVKPCGLTVDEKTTNVDVFYGCDCVWIGETAYALVRDAPVLKKVYIALQPIVGCPLIPGCDWMSGDAPSNVSFHWFVAEKPHAHRVIRDPTTSELQLEGWTHVFTGEIFYPTAECADKFVSVIVDFGEDPLIKTATVTKSVLLLDEPFIFEERQSQHCSSALPETDRVRIVCYNVLASLYLDLKLEQSELFFSYCPAHYQEFCYRYPIILRELKGYNSDILCLQEVDFRMQKSFMIKFLDDAGFHSEFRRLSGEVNEGQLIAFRRSKFRLVESLPPLGDLSAKPTSEWNPHQGVRISDLADGDRYPENRDIADLLASEPEVQKYLMKKATALQVVHLESIGDASVHLLILNTHLSWDPAYEHIKLLQAVLSLRYLHSVRKRVQAEFPSAKVTSLFCGDLNSMPDSAVVQLLRDGHVSESASTWGSHSGIHFSEDVAYTSLAGFPEYTNYTKVGDRGFAGCLDYIWSHPPLKVEHVVPLPRHELVIKYSAIPSKIAPSDHLALVCDIRL